MRQKVRYIRPQLYCSYFTDLENLDWVSDHEMSTLHRRTKVHQDDVHHIPRGAEGTEMHGNTERDVEGIQRQEQETSQSEPAESENGSSDFFFLLYLRRYELFRGCPALVQKISFSSGSQRITIYM